jgi:hypothetical protein
VTSYVTANGAADYRSCRCSSVIAVPATKLMTNHTTDDCAEQRAAAHFVSSVIDGVVLGVPPTFLNWTPDRNVMYGRL